MSEISDLHNRAMELATHAESLRMAGDEAAAVPLFRSAMESERDAALKVPANLEPTRSVLLRSAASLALDCGANREAERLIAVALAGDPPDEIADELRDLYETATFRRHLAVKGTTIGKGEFQMSLSGDAVGFGFIDIDEYFPRVETVESLLVRTIERKNDIPFRERGRADKSIMDNFGLYLTVPRAASFAVTIRVGRPVVQRQLFTNESDVVFEFIECMRLFSADEYESLRSRIGSASYFRNFVSQARSLSPDGSRIRTVGFTADYQNTRNEVALKRVNFDRWLPKAPKKSQVVYLFGVLTSAHKDENRADRNNIGIRDVLGRTQTLRVPKSLMNDYVRPYWDLPVVATCHRTEGGKYQLADLKRHYGDLPMPADESKGTS